MIRGRRNLARITAMLLDVAVIVAATAPFTLAAAEQSSEEASPKTAVPSRPNVLFIICDQYRADAIAALGNSHLKTPNIDRLVSRGVTYTKAYSTCPECVPARYTIRTGCEPPKTAIYCNGAPQPVAGQAKQMEDRCGKYLARVMGKLGYRTFGIGKFHTHPDMSEDIGYQTYLPTVLGCNINRENVYTRHMTKLPYDAYADFIAKSHPEFNWLDSWVGEVGPMYYVPQVRPIPAKICVESWAADRTVEEIQRADGGPFFGVVSFFGPHAPMAPPEPYNRLYSADKMPNAVRGDKTIDFMDDRIPAEAYATGAEEANPALVRLLKARYYGEITYLDECIGRILDAVEARPDAHNTLICFFADHGEMLGDHGGWQKENFFEASTRIPLLLSWPSKLRKNTKSSELVCLTDLFGIATTAAGKPELRDGVDVLGALAGQSKPREYLIGYFGEPGTPAFKVMVREKNWKYLFLANGGREQLFDVANDPDELKQQADAQPEIVNRLRAVAVKAVSAPNADRALHNSSLRSFPFKEFPRRRYY